MPSTATLPLIRSRDNQPDKNLLQWSIAPVLVLFQIGAVAALFSFSWNALFVAIFLYWVTGGLGLGRCYHRLLTHRFYTTPKWFEHFLTICGLAEPDSKRGVEPDGCHRHLLQPLNRLWRAQRCSENYVASRSTVDCLDFVLSDCGH
jgi:hypothetical protein